MKNTYSPMEPGQRFGRLVSIRRSGTAPSGNALWQFVCDCGTKCISRSADVKRGFKVSCGCRRSEVAAENGRLSSTTHEMFGTAEHNAWDNLIQRCENTKSAVYKDYGARGIKVCEGWRESFESFYADVGPRPSPKHSIDRYPDNNGNYEPTNCRWATRKEQGRNQRSNRLVTFEGRAMALSEFCEITGIPRSKAKYHLNAGFGAADIISVCS